MYLAAMLPVFLHSGERGHVAALLTLANAPITGLVWVGGGGGEGGVQGQPTGNLTFSGFQMSISPPLSLHFESNATPRAS